MSDKTEMLKVLRKLPDILFVEPSAQLVTQDELHDRARELLQQRSLPADHPYVGWHRQANGFDAKGGLRSVQRIYFGGDHEIVRRALSALEDGGFAVLGGRSSQEAFAVRRDARPEGIGAEGIGAEGIDAEQLEAWRIRLAVLGDELRAPLREGEAARLHELVAGIPAAPPLRELLVPALRALRLRDELSAADLETALAPEQLAGLGQETSPLVVHALQHGHPLARSAVAALAADGRADGPMLMAWGGPEALEAARAHALRNPRHIPREYLALVSASGADAVAAGVALAEEIRNDHPDDDAVADQVVIALVEQFGGGSVRERLQLVRDPRVPLRLRLRAVESGSGRPCDPGEQTAFQTHRPGVGVTADELAAWLDATDAVRRECGLPPSPGYDISDRRAQQRAVELREFMLARHRDGMLTALRRDDLDEPALAVLLELLYPAGLLSADVLDPLTVDWQERFFVEPDTYTPAPPAVVTLAVACSTAGHPRAREIVDTVVGDTRRWTEPLRLLLTGGLNWGAEADRRAAGELIEIAHSGSARVASGREARFALSLVTARLRGIDPVRAACQLSAEAPGSPRYIALGFAGAAIALAEGGSGLRAHSFEELSPRALRAAVALAEDESLPLAARRNLLHHAARSNLLDHPLERAYATLPADEVAALRQRLEALTLGPLSVD